MKKTTIVASVISIIFSTPLWADNNNNFTDRGRVIHSKPIYETVRTNYPEERCWNEPTRHRGAVGGRSYTPTIAGAIVGGVVGNQFGKGSGKDILTVAGAVLGASVGHDMGRQPPRRSYTTSERRCEQVDNYREHEEVVGYRVKYKYNGKVFWTRADRDPGKYIPLQISVVPVYGSDYAYQGYDR